MRKLLVLALIVGLIPFAFGCRLFGDYDDDGAVAATTTSNVTTITPSIVLPADDVAAASIQAAISTLNASLTLTLNDGTTVAMNLDTTYTGTGKKYKAASAVAISKLNKDSSGTNYQFSVKVVLSNGQSVNIVVLVPVAIQGTTSSATTTDVIATVTLKTSGGTLTYTYTVTYIPLGTTTTTTTTTTTPPSTFTPTTLPDFYVEKVTYVGATESVLSNVNSYGVDYVAPKFKVYFNAEISAIPTTYSVKATNAAGVSVTFSSSDKGLATMSINATDKKVLDITIYGQTGSQNLEPNTKYTVAFTSATVTSTGAKTATLNATDYVFTTKDLWDAQSSTGTSVTTFDYAAGTTYVTTSAAKIVMTFTSAIATPDFSTAKFTKTVGTTSVEGAYTTYFDTATLSTDGKTLTIPFKSGKTLAAGSYSIAWKAGTFKYASGTSIDTSRTITFTVK